MRGARLLGPFWDVHLDPACDPPAHDRDVFELLAEFWSRLEVARTHLGDDLILVELVAHLQNQLVGAAIVLNIKMSLMASDEET